MPNYRYYCLDGAGRIHDAKWFDAASDEEALSMVRQMHPDGHCEVWLGRQMIGSIKPDQIQMRA
jgi:hypothetical protein